IPTIMPRRSAGNAAVRIVRLSGSTTAPPRPCTARAAIRIDASGVSAQAADASVNSVSPARNTLRRPNLSPRAAAGRGRVQGGCGRHVGIDTPPAPNWAGRDRPLRRPGGVYTIGATSRCEDGQMTTELTALARAGDEDAFRALVEPYKSELRLHCYRILGSMQDAEDALQETLLAAWRGLGGFQGRSSIRTWLYTVATNRALNALRAARRRPSVELSIPESELPEPTRVGEPLWLEPYPDVLLEDVADAPPGPEARYAAKEAVSLAFVTALQLLPARQRAALILRDVLGFHAAEVAQMLDSTVESVTSALKRARATLERELPRPEPAPEPTSPGERELVERLTAACTTNDID